MRFVSRLVNRLFTSAGDELGDAHYTDNGKDWLICNMQNGPGGRTHKPIPLHTAGIKREDDLNTGCVISYKSRDEFHRFVRDCSENEDGFSLNYHGQDWLRCGPGETLHRIPPYTLAITKENDLNNNGIIRRTFLHVRYLLYRSNRNR